MIRMICSVLVSVLLAVMLAGCGPTRKGMETDPAAALDLDFPGALHEPAPPEAKWRGHQLKDCPEDLPAPGRVESLLGLCTEFFQEGSGSDGMIELEMALDEGLRHGLIDLTLGQLYLLAGQGDQALLPVEGPAADVGDWSRNKARLLARADRLLHRAREAMPSEAAVDYLLADVARAQGDQEKAASFAELAQGKCTDGRGFTILRTFQQLNRYPAKYLGGASPRFPEDALARGVDGEVVVDLLVDPGARVRQAELISSPDPALAQAALTALREGDFEAARVGKYPVWSWLRVTIAFNLSP